MSNIPTTQLKLQGLQTYLALQEEVGEGNLPPFGVFLERFQPLLAKQLGVSLTNSSLVTLNVRLNPRCSVQTRIRVDVASATWYETLCQDLGVASLTTFARGGVPLTQVPVSELSQFNSIRANYSTPFPLEAGFAPIKAPLKYSPVQSDLAQAWFNRAMLSVAYAVGDAIHAKLPVLSDEANFAKADEMSWSVMVATINNKTLMQSILGQALDSIPPLSSESKLSTQARKSIMAHVYSGLFQTLEHHEEDFGEEFLNQALTKLESMPQKESVQQFTQARNANLFEDEIAFDAAVPTINNVEIRESIISKLRTMNKKRKANAAQRKADKAKDDAKVAPDKADRKAERAKEKAAKAKDQLKKRKEMVAEKAKAKAKAKASEESPVANMIGNLILEYCNQESELPILAQIIACEPKPKEAEIKSTPVAILGVPLMTPIPEPTPTPVQVPVPVAIPNVPTITLEEFRGKFQKTHRQILSYLHTSPTLSNSRVYLYSDQTLGANPSSATIKQSLARSPLSHDRGTTLGSFILKEFEGRVFHIVK